MQCIAIVLVCLVLAPPACDGRVRHLSDAVFTHDSHPEASTRSTAGRFLKSDALGITHCSLQGVLGDEDVTLHIWLRMVPPSVVAPTLCAQGRPPAPNCNHTALARGFALLQSSRSSIPYYNRAGIQLLQARSLLLFSQHIYLRSYVTGAEYPLQLILPFTLGGRGTGSGGRADGEGAGTRHSDLSSWLASASHRNASRPKVRGQGWTSHVMDLSGRLELQEEDVNQQDFELRATGFSWHCPFLAEPPVLQQQPERQWQETGTPAQPATAGQEHAPVPSAQVSQGPGAWRHHLVSSLSNQTEVWQVLSPFHSMDVADYALMLWHRVLWHRPMGVHRYLLYVDGSLSALVREPLIQALVSQGVLHIVAYVEMPKHEEQLLQPTLTDMYVMQVLAYNHALLALWGSDSLVLVADVDEYIITPKPTSVVQAFTECRNTTVARALVPAPDQTVKAWMLRKKPLAGLQLRRTDAVCAPGAHPLQCSPNTPGLMSWVSTTPGDVVAGRQAHPLTWHGMTAGADLWQLHNTKMLVDPNLARDIHVHFFQHSNGTVREQADTSCIRLLHLVDLYRVRHVQESSSAQASANGGDSGWWWPAKALSSGEARIPSNTSQQNPEI